MIESITGGAQAIVAIVLLLGACIFFHETGHFVLAKLAGMLVHEFAIGFGPRLVSFKRGETLYSIRLIPLGGYVRIAGMDPEERDAERGFHTFPRWQGFTVLVAGSLMNVVLAAVAFIVIAAVSGLPVFPDYTIRVSKVLPGGAAEAAGIQGGDEIVSMDGISHSLFVEDVRSGSPAAQAGIGANNLIYEVEEDEVTVPPELLSAVQEHAGGSVQVEIAAYDAKGNINDLSSGLLRVPGSVAEAQKAEAAAVVEKALGMTLAPLDRSATVRYISDRPEEKVALRVSREGREFDVALTPRVEWARVPTEDESGRLSSAHQKVGRIGVVLTGAREPVGVGRAIVYGVEHSVGAVVMVSYGLAEMIRGKVAPQASGPVGIAAMTAERLRIGWTAVVQLLGIISANLAVINLFPIPPFDGFRIALLGIEGVMGRRVDAKKELAVTIAGVALLLGLFLVITFRDILNLVFYSTP